MKHKLFFKTLASMLLAFCCVVNAWGTDTYTKITSLADLTDGDYVFAYDYNGGTQIVMKNTSSTTNKLDGVALSLTDGKYSDPGAAHVWTFSKVVNGENTYYTVYNSSVKKYAKANSTGLSLDDAAYNYVVTWDGTNNCFRINSSAATTYYLCGYVNGTTYQFQSTTSGSGAKYHVHLYKKDAGSTYTDVYL